MKIKLFLVSFLFISITYCQTKTSTLKENNTKTEVEIDSLTVKKHLYTLASDAMEGRKVGTPGIEKAAKYIEGEFKRIGLTTFNDLPSYRQNFRKNEMDLFNIIGVLEGKSKKDEFVVISAHFDHLGIKSSGEDKIYNGADDDASGVSAVLALAEYFKNIASNERTIVFVTFTGEEQGMYGSTYFGTQINAKDYVAGINIEMIGKESKFGPKTAWLTGFKRSDFGKIIQKNLENTAYKLYPDPYIGYNLFFRSDNASMAKLGIPAHTFSTGPLDNDKHYHQVSDEAETLNITTITETIKAIAKGTKSIIDGTDTPTRIED